MNRYFHKKWNLHQRNKFNNNDVNVLNNYIFNKYLNMLRKIIDILCVYLKV